MREIRVGIDTGGTFTDFVISDGRSVSTGKVLSTPENPSLSILDGLSRFLPCLSNSVIIHGTTVATNALLERKGAKAALITTKGFEDILSIGRQTRRNLYSFRGERRRPIIDRKFCYGIDERTSASGEAEQAPSLEEIRAIIEKIKTAGIEAVAISLINSYANPSHENMILRELEKRGVLASASSRILPEYREYERTSTIAVNAYLIPILGRYLSLLEKKLAGVDLKIMQSNEGYISAAKARLEPIRTALSGPAGGVVGSFYLAKAAGFPRIVSFDMGGTSTDVSLIDGKIRRSSENIIGDFPVRLPIIDIHSVGAGGGSIAHIDQGGSLRVGPESAGADPGPACYGKGDLPTVTDANLLLGRIDPDFFLGGKMKIYPQRSLDAIRKLGARLGKSLIETAEGIIDIANANMEKAIRVISVERGFDPRDFSLFSFGGAGGMHAAEISSHLRMRRVIVPGNAGVLSAFGLLLADSVKDYSCSILKVVGQIRAQDLERRFAELERQGLRDLGKDGFQKSAIILERSLDLRYLGQSYEITLPYSAGSFAGLEDAFHRSHRKLYSYHHPQGQVEIVNVRLNARGLSRKIRLQKKSPQAPCRSTKLKKQPLYFQGKRLSGDVYDRALLSPYTQFAGPALFVDFGSTTFLPPGFRLTIDGYMNLLIRRDPR